jgi:hypothetical protein
MPANFDLSMLALKAICPNNEILYDDVGLPSVMVRIPKMTYAELGLGESTDVFPAFIVNGSEVPEIYISKYQNCVYNGRAYSLPARAPQTSVTFDATISRCTAKGAGWHLMTRMEWAMLALWCKKNGFMPKGNNDNGKDVEETIYRAIPCSFDGTTRQKVLTGTGPLTWSHDGTPSGIWDLNGNVSERVGGLRTVYGEVQVLINNNAADSSHLQAADSAEWKAINASTGAFVTPDGSGTTVGSVKMDYVSSHWQYDTAISSKSDSSRNCAFEAVTCSANIGDAAKLILQSLCLLKNDDTAGAYLGDLLYANNGAAERVFRCGGSYGSGAYAGVFFLVGDYARSHSYANIGFRSAFVKLPTA